MIGGDGESAGPGGRMAVDREGQMQGFVSLLSEAQLADLHAIGRIQRFAKGARLLSERQVGDRVMALLAGRVKITGVNDAGRDAVFGFRSAGDLVGELSAMRRSPALGQRRGARTRRRAATVGTPDFLAYLERHPPVALVVMRLLCERLRDADRKRVEFAAADGVDRVAARLLELAERFGETAADASVTIDLPLPRRSSQAGRHAARGRRAGAAAKRELGWVQAATSSRCSIQASAAGARELTRARAELARGPQRSAPFDAFAARRMTWSALRRSDRLRTSPPTGPPTAAREVSDSPPPTRHRRPS